MSPALPQFLPIFFLKTEELCSQNTQTISLASIYSSNKHDIDNTKDIHYAALSVFTVGKAVWQCWNFWLSFGTWTHCKLPELAITTCLVPTFNPYGRIRFNYITSFEYYLVLYRFGYGEADIELSSLSLEAVTSSAQQASFLTIPRRAPN